MGKPESESGAESMRSAGEMHRDIDACIVGAVNTCADLDSATKGYVHHALITFGNLIKAAADFSRADDPRAELIVGIIKDTLRGLIPVVKEIDSECCLCRTVVDSPRRVMFLEDILEREHSSDRTFLTPDGIKTLAGKKVSNYAVITLTPEEESRLGIDVGSVVSEHFVGKQYNPREYYVEKFWVYLPTARVYLQGTIVRKKGASGDDFLDLLFTSAEQR